MVESEPAIEVRKLSKSYLVPVREPGMGQALRSIFRRERKQVDAVVEVDFAIAPGEVVGFLGPNGAGKTTTLKMLSGLIQPSAGEVRVLGYEPARRANAYLRQITLVMGQRNQLIWDIPAADSFERNRAIYRLSDREFEASRDELVELLALGDLLGKPVRNLSLGERMKCEIAAALLHQPTVLFLDEPTLGLDVSAQRRIRSFIEQYNKKRGATVLLTSHYMADVQALCKRVIVIHQGRILFDGDLADLVRRFSTEKTIVVELEAGGREVAASQLTEYGEIVERTAGRFRLRVAQAETARTTARILSELSVADLTVEDPPIEEVIERVFAGE